MRNGRELRVEVRLTNWQRVNGQYFPGQIVRLENDANTATITLISLQSR